MPLRAVRCPDTHPGITRPRRSWAGPGRWVQQRPIRRTARLESELVHGDVRKNPTELHARLLRQERRRHAFHRRQSAALNRESLEERGHAQPTNDLTEGVENNLPDGDEILNMGGLPDN